MLKELAFSLKSVYHFIGETSDNDVVERQARKATPSPPPPTTSLVLQQLEKKKKKKKKIEISPVFADIDFYKSTNHSRLTVFVILYAGRNFIKIKAHQSHQQDLMPYLETLILENPRWASDTGLADLKWKELVHILKAMWRRYKSGKKLKDFEISVGYARTIYDSYLEFGK